MPTQFGNGKRVDGLAVKKSGDFEDRVTLQARVKRLGSITYECEIVISRLNHVLFNNSPLEGCELDCSAEPSIEEEVELALSQATTNLDNLNAMLRRATQEYD